MVGEKIRQARLAQNRSLSDIAAKAKISVATLSRIENDKQSIDVGLFVTLAKVLKTSPHALFGEEPQDEKGVDPLARRIASLEPRDRADLWRELAAERRTTRSSSRRSQVQQVFQEVEELVAQLDLLREELEAVRTRMRRRR